MMGGAAASRCRRTSPSCSLAVSCPVASSQSAWSVAIIVAPRALPSSPQEERGARGEGKGGTEKGGKGAIFVRWHDHLGAQIVRHSGQRSLRLCCFVSDPLGGYSLPAALARAAPVFALTGTASVPATTGSITSTVTPAAEVPSAGTDRTVITVCARHVGVGKGGAACLT